MADLSASMILPSSPRQSSFLVDSIGVVSESPIAKKGAKEIKVKVLNTFLLKQIIEEDGNLTMVGTFVQNCFESPEAKEMLVGKELKEDKIKFEYRFNDETAEDGSDFVKPRRSEKHDGLDMGDVHRHTYQVKAPLDVDVEFDFFPFKVVSAKLLVELSSFATEDGQLTIRPNLLVHTEDKTNMFNIQKDPLKNPKEKNIFGQEIQIKPFDLAKDRMDKCESYDFISPFPKVSLLYETKKQYTPKFLMKFMMVEDGMKKFVEIVAPMFLIAVMNTIHVLNPDEGVETADYLANSATFALSVLVFLPTMVGTSRVQQLFTVNNLYIVCIFLGLTLSSIPDTFANGNRRWAIAGMWINWASFIFPIFNSMRYWNFARKALHDANDSHFWQTEEKKNFHYENRFDAKKFAKEAKDCAHCLKTVEEIIELNEKDENELTKMEVKLRPEFAKKQKIRVLDFASERRVKQKLRQRQDK